MEQISQLTQISREIMNKKDLIFKIYKYLTDTTNLTRGEYYDIVEVILDFVAADLNFKRLKKITVKELMYTLEEANEKLSQLKQTKLELLKKMCENRKSPNNLKICAEFEAICKKIKNLNFWSTSIAGYDVKNKVIFIPKFQNGMLREEIFRVLVHEFRHAYQEHHFPLKIYTRFTEVNYQQFAGDEQNSRWIANGAEYDANKYVLQTLNKVYREVDQSLSTKAGRNLRVSTAHMCIELALLVQQHKSMAKFRSYYKRAKPKSQIKKKNDNENETR